MKGKIKILIVGVALITMAATAVAGGPGYGMGGNVNCPAGMNQLNLTPEQKTKLGELREKHWKDTVSLRNDMQAKRLDLRNLWNSPNPEKSMILTKQKEMNDLRDEMQVVATDFRLEMRKILTPEQIAQLGNFGPGLGFHRGMGRMRMGGQGPGGGPGGKPAVN
jgi:Spy/CpxP family protein refolding chaperone